ncbi:CDP-diacylglycerol--glycerol-3-phosphate 3-phosphatidyltransferase [Anaerobacterium chartisolvens]|uniref:CDP-diacylglycerol--glycerol-3-phosphate 3-phosphatidyltransferase n=1 Tax=Anaerobacterium chartisolvens TaxID=1297424 RepID=A0A369BEQ1_9FIRM|nr:CDP-diacylglycerol--glycerol-3-phosphate 3-phosphatidyltransferase [Anaerobacterium chartisolvens]RCX20019.1 CDP-diacylglycerol--glycerol-3-phosphate 3-phosphatidyltransferase [Anaerobacterium chartisolvens]
MNLPNKITFSRILIVPVFMIFVIPFPDSVLYSGLFEFIRPQMLQFNQFVLNYGNYIAAVIFIIASSTDGVDGYIARKRKEVTKLGKFLDPIADKLLVTAALIALVERNAITGGGISGWVAMIIMAREWIVTGLRLIAAGEGIVISASNLGKIKTVSQMIAISLTLLNNFPFSLIFPEFRFDRWTMLAAVIITAYSGYDYLSKNIKIINVKE